VVRCLALSYFVTGITVLMCTLTGSMALCLPVCASGRIMAFGPSFRWPPELLAGRTANGASFSFLLAPPGFDDD